MSERDSVSHQDRNERCNVLQRLDDVQYCDTNVVVGCAIALAEQNANCANKSNTERAHYQRQHEVVSR